MKPRWNKNERQVFSFISKMAFLRDDELGDKWHARVNQSFSGSSVSFRREETTTLLCHKNGSFGAGYFRRKKIAHLR